MSGGIQTLSRISIVLPSKVELHKKKEVDSSQHSNTQNFHDQETIKTRFVELEIRICDSKIRNKLPRFRNS